jgi:hypothetical protein
MEHSFSQRLVYIVILTTDTTAVVLPIQYENWALDSDIATLFCHFSSWKKKYIILKQRLIKAFGNM